jgi:class 3 adenylate cyclase/predicted ATPase
MRTAMKFSEVVAQTLAWLQRDGRVSYRALKREFELDDEFLADLKAELIEVREVAVDKDGKMLVWAGSTTVASTRLSVASPQPFSAGLRTADPGRWTPPYLAERIRAATLTEGERKTITALFADLKGSTALIEGLDPEEARAIIDPALQLMMDAVHRYEGYVAQALGDGIFALFGAPIAHEDHPQRALYAALRMQEEMRRYGDQVRLKHGVPLAMRVGVNTGEVVVRSIRKDDLHTDYVPVGHATNLAARMEQMATPGSILLTEHTRKLVEGYFELKALGAAEIKGMEAPLHVYEVVGPGPLRTRLQVAASRGLTRFVGRQSELEQIKRALEQAREGQGQIVGVMGEPGLGKSRLFHEFKLLSQGGCLILEAYSVSHGKASPYLPLIELLKSYFQVQPQDDERSRREKIGGKVLMLDRSLEDTLPYLFALLGLDDPNSSLQQMDPQIRRRRTFEAIKKLLLRESLNQPLILIFEDLHWIGGETQGFLDVLSESVASARILLLVNYRPEYRHEWGTKTYYTQLRLAPFRKAEAEEFLDMLLGTTVGADLRVGPQGPGAHIGAPLRDLKHLILEKTEGTPFFMEEVVQELIEQGVLIRDRVGADLRVGPGGAGAHTGAPLQIPTTVQGVLAARIDRLAPDEKSLLQQLAVIGREFPLRLVRQVLPQPEDELYRGLASLQRKEFLYEQPAFPEVEYIFKHALTQEVTYNSVLIERRKALHEQTGQAIERIYHQQLEEHYDELAHHYSRSENTEKAITYLHRAGQQAARRSANAEAVQHLTAALHLLYTFPDTPERARQELALQLVLGAPLVAVKSWGAPEVENLYTRALELCRQAGESPQLFPVLEGLAVFYFTRGELLTARQLGEQMLGIARNVQDSSLLLEAHHLLGNVWAGLGELEKAQVHLAQGISLYDLHQHRNHAFRYGGHDSGVCCLSLHSLVLWFLGYPDQAVKGARAALVLAHEVAHPVSSALALWLVAQLHLLSRDSQAARELAQELLSFAEQQDLPYFAAVGTILLYRAQFAQQQNAECIVQMRTGLATSRAMGAEITRTYFLSLLAEVLGQAGQPDEALAVVEEALAIRLKGGEHSYEADLSRLKGELTLQKLSVASYQLPATDPQPPAPSTQAEAEAEACFLKAIDIARQQQAKSLELRATVSLARLWQRQGKQHDARKALSEIYGWFTEGFDTKDLQEAKVLLEEVTAKLEVEPSRKEIL